MLAFLSLSGSRNLATPLHPIIIVMLACLLLASSAVLPPMSPDSLWTPVWWICPHLLCLIPMIGPLIYQAGEGISWRKWLVLVLLINSMAFQLAPDPVGMLWPPPPSVGLLTLLLWSQSLLVARLQRNTVIIYISRVSVALCTVDLVRAQWRSLLWMSLWVTPRKALTSSISVPVNHPELNLVPTLGLTPSQLVGSEVGPLEDSRTTHDVCLKLRHVDVGWSWLKR